MRRGEGFTICQFTVSFKDHYVWHSGMEFILPSIPVVVIRLNEFDVGPSGGTFVEQGVLLVG